MQIEMPFINSGIDYSIVICTYNPDERLLQRCLEAVLNLNIDDITTEVILVDNNSMVPIESLSYVRRYLGKIPSIKTIIVPAKGIKNARIAAIKEAKGKYIVYFDSDNEPDRAYLQELKKLNDKYPQVAAIGPGHLSVDFIDGIEESIENYARTAFRERHEDTIKFSGLPEWQPCYPLGAGLCINSFLLKEYVNLARQGKFSISDPNGNQLNSGDDMQMVLLCISKGYFAGVSAALKIRHLIPAMRASYKYLQRLLYNTGISYESSIVQVFPEHIDRLKQEIISRPKFSRGVLKKFLKARWKPDSHKMFNLVQFIAFNAGTYLALNKQIPIPIKRIVKYLELD